MSTFKRDGFWHFRFMHRGRLIRKSTKQRDRRVAEQIEAAERIALAKGDAGLGEKPALPTLERFLLDRVTPWSAKRKTTTATWFHSGIKPVVEHKPLAKLRLDEITS